MSVVDGIPWRRNNVVDFVEVVADIAVLKLASCQSHPSVGRIRLILLGYE